MDVMTAKVEKEMRNTITRRVNCDTANADKVVSAAQEQMDAIRRSESSTAWTRCPSRCRTPPCCASPTRRQACPTWPG